MFGSTPLLLTYRLSYHVCQLVQLSMAVGIPGPVLSLLMYQLKSCEGDVVSGIELATKAVCYLFSTYRLACCWERYNGRV